MSKRGYISRYLLILKKLRAKPYASFEDLQRHIDHQLEFLQMQDEDLNMGFSKRTLQRDIREIRSLFGVDIEYSARHKGYFIAQNETENLNFQRMMEAFDLFNSLNLAQDFTPFVHLEQRRPQGTENLYGLLHAIKNKLAIEFTYQKFWEDEVTQRTAEPYALKEFRNRWYVLAKDDRDGITKSFALDRLSALYVTKKVFYTTPEKNLEDNYRHCFGIINPTNEAPEDIVLSFDPFQGKYIRTLPLHATQKVLKDDDEELKIGLKLCITHDFVMELLSFGDNMKVLQPASLAESIQRAHQDAANQYQ